MKFQGGVIPKYLANRIAEAFIHSQLDTEDNEYIFLQDICKHWKDGLGVVKDDMFVQLQKLVQGLYIELQKAGSYLCNGRMDPHSEFF